MSADIENALTVLAFSQPFFGTLLAMTSLVESDEIPTMATDGRTIYYNPAFLDGLSEARIRGVLMHELMHIVYLHCDPGRRAGRDPCGWNAACDFAINQEIVSWMFALPEGGLLDRKYRGMAAEAIYDLLPAGGVCRGGDCRCRDRLLPMSGDSKEEMMGRIITAAEASGRLPEDIELWVRSLKASRVPWERVLRSFLHQALSHDDIGWLPPSRRHLWDDRYLPSARPGRRGRLVAAVDTSGSISQGQLRAFAAEIKGLFEFCDELTAVTCDAKVRECVRLGSFEDFLKKLKFKGGGGTDFRPVFELAEADRMRPDALVYLTDGKGIFPKTRPARYPVLWCLTEARAVPWGFSVAIAKQ